MSKVLVPATKLPVALIQEVSAKTGNPYHRIEIDVSDTYSLKLFVNDEQAALILELLKNQKSDED